MFKLYGAKGTGSAGVQAVLEYTGVAYGMATLDLSAGQHKKPAYLSINPRGQVPCLILEDGTPLSESAAIMMHVADQNPHSDLMPPIGSVERAKVYRWMLFLATNIYESVLRVEHPQNYTTDDEQTGVVVSAQIAVDHAFAVLDEALAESNYLAGERLSVADIYLAMLFTWHRDGATLRENCPNVVRTFDLVIGNPSVAKALAENDLL